MPTKKILRVFEFDELILDRVYNGIKFDNNYLTSIQKFNTRNNNKYFTLIHQGVKFSNYVGVIEIGDLIIEILPKADNHLNINTPEDVKASWQNILLHMLKKSGLINVISLTNAHLRLQSATLLDIYIDQFISEVEMIMRRGLLKQYRLSRENVKYFKGRLLVSENIQNNFIDKTKFFTEHQIYDYNNLLNQIIAQALHVLVLIAKPSFQDRLSRILLDYPEVTNIRINQSAFNKIIYNRRNEYYKKTLELAKLILLNYNPDIQSGRNYVLAILFDMNNLWEKYIYKTLYQNKSDHGYKVNPQDAKYFWEHKRIKPDLVLEKDNKKYIVDTKWKRVNMSNPSDADLKQMYAYNMYWEANKSMLLYPNIHGANNHTNYGKFHKGTPEHDNNGNYCKLGFVDVWNEVDGEIELNKSIAIDIINQLEEE